MIDSIQEFDLSITHWIRDNLSCGFLDVTMTAATYMVVIWYIAAIALILKKGYRFRGASLLTACVLSAVFTDFFIKLLVMRERPFICDPELTIIIPPPFGSSFPSGHTCLAFAGSVTLFGVKKLFGIISLCFAFIVAFSRMYLCVHFLTDVIAGAILGVILGLISVIIFKKLEKKAVSH